MLDTELDYFSMKYTFMSLHKGEEKNYNVKLISENLANFIFLGTTITDGNDVHGSITIRKKFGKCLLLFT
jgi:hypothetical protein